MRILVDENVPGDVVAALVEQGHDVAWVRMDSPGISDLQVMERAQAEHRLILTFDKDFGELVFRERETVAGVILLRISAPSSAHVARVVATTLESRADWEGHFSVVEDDRIRMTPMPPGQT